MGSGLWHIVQKLTDSTQHSFSTERQTLTMGPELGSAPWQDTETWSGKSAWDLVYGTLFMICRAGAEGWQKSVHQRGNGIE